MTAYVVGFAFDTQRRVTLIRKTHPEWQKGLLNGVGGKIDSGDHSGNLPDTQAMASLVAMCREFKEETGVVIAPERWKMYHRERWQNGNSVDFYATALRPGEWPKTQTDEHIEMMYWEHLNRHQWEMASVMYNLPYLIPMAYIHLYGHPENLPFHA